MSLAQFSMSSVRSALFLSSLVINHLPKSSHQPIPLHAAVGLIACYTGLILWKLFLALDSDQYPIKTYSDVSERVIGRWFRHLCTILQSLQLIINVCENPSFIFVPIIDDLDCVHFLSIDHVAPI